MWRCNERQGAASIQVCSEFILGNSCRNSWASALRFHLSLQGRTCFDALQRLEAQKPGQVWKEEEPSLRTQEPSAFWNISIVGQAWQEFRSSWTHTHTHTGTNSRALRMWPQLTPPSTRLLHTVQISPPRGVGVFVFLLLWKAWNTYRSAAYVFSVFFQMFILSTFLLTQSYHFVQLQVAVTAFPSPPRLCPRIRQQYLYNSILNKCKERNYMPHLPSRSTHFEN